MRREGAVEVRREARRPRKLRAGARGSQTLARQGGARAVHRRSWQGICLAPQFATPDSRSRSAVDHVRRLDDMSTTLGWYSEGGPVMLLILLVGVAGLAVLVERLYVDRVPRRRHNGRAVHRARHSARARRQGRRSHQGVRGVDRRAARHGFAHSAQPQPRRERSAERRRCRGAACAPKLTRRTRLSADARDRRHSARRARHGARRSRRASDAPAATDHNVQLSAGARACAHADGVRTGGRDRADARRAVSREPGGVHHRRRFTNSRRG